MSFNKTLREFNELLNQALYLCSKQILIAAVGNNQPIEFALNLLFGTLLNPKDRVPSVTFSREILNGLLFKYPAHIYSILTLIEKCSNVYNYQTEFVKLINNNNNNNIDNNTKVTIDESFFNYAISAEFNQVFKQVYQHDTSVVNPLHLYLYENACIDTKDSTVLIETINHFILNILIPHDFSLVLKQLNAAQARIAEDHHTDKQAVLLPLLLFESSFQKYMVNELKEYTNDFIPAILTCIQNIYKLCGVVESIDALATHYRFIPLHNLKYLPAHLISLIIVNFKINFAVATSIRLLTMKELDVINDDELFQSYIQSYTDKYNINTINIINNDLDQQYIALNNKFEVALITDLIVKPLEDTESLPDTVIQSEHISQAESTASTKIKKLVNQIVQGRYIINKNAHDIPNNQLLELISIAQQNNNAGIVWDLLKSLNYSGFRHNCALLKDYLSLESLPDGSNDDATEADEMKIGDEVYQNASLLQNINNPNNENINVFNQNLMSFPAAVRASLLKRVEQQVNIEDANLKLVVPNNTDASYVTFKNLLYKRYLIDKLYLYAYYQYYKISNAPVTAVRESVLPIDFCLYHRICNTELELNALNLDTQFNFIFNAIERFITNNQTITFNINESLLSMVRNLEYCLQLQEDFRYVHKVLRVDVAVGTYLRAGVINPHGYLQVNNDVGNVPNLNDYVNRLKAIKNTMSLYHDPTYTILFPDRMNTIKHQYFLQSLMRIDFESVDESVVNFEESIGLSGSDEVYLKRLHSINDFYIECHKHDNNQFVRTSFGAVHLANQVSLYDEWKFHYVEATNLKLLKIGLQHGEFNLSQIGSGKREYIYKGGSFYKYLNLTELPLEPLGVYTELNEKNFIDNCFVHALKSMGYSDQSKLNRIKHLLVRKETVFKRNLNKICEILGIRVYILHIREDGNAIDKNKTWKPKKQDLSRPIYRIFLEDSHYMANLKFDNISKHYIKYYQEFKNLNVPTYAYKNTRGAIINTGPVSIDLSKVSDAFDPNYTKRDRDMRANTREIIKFLRFTNNVKKAIQASDVHCTNTYVNKPEFYVKPAAFNDEDSKEIKHCEYKNSLIKKLRAEQDHEKHQALATELLSNEKSIENVKAEAEFCKQFADSEKIRAFKPKFIVSASDWAKESKKSKDPMPWQQKFKNWTDILYMDTETGACSQVQEDRDTRQDKRKVDDLHKVYCCAYARDSTDTKYTFKGHNCIPDMLSSLECGRYLVYCHNLKFDYHFVIKYLQQLNNNNEISMIKNNGIIYQIKAWYFVNKPGLSNTAGYFIELVFRDSYKFLPKKLSDIPKTMGLSSVIKEVMPYSLLHENTMFLNTIPFNLVTKFYSKPEYQPVDLNIIRHELPGNVIFTPSLLTKIACAWNNDDFKQLMRNSVKWGCFNQLAEWKAVDYSLEYCFNDCLVLKKGLQKFRQLMFSITAEDIHDCITLPSLSHSFLINSECYNQVYMIKGPVREFIQKTVVGGRVMLNSNQRQLKTGSIQDFDAVSLYPSAIALHPGPLCGTPKFLLPEQKNMDFLNTVDGYFIKIVVTKVTTNLEFPVLSIKNEDGTRDWTNELIGKEIHVDKFTLEDAVKHQGIEFIIVDGYYYDQGRNNTVIEVMKYLFEIRKVYKALKNAMGDALQEIIKLIMNSSYGKTIEKAHDMALRIVHKSKKLNFEKTNAQLLKESTLYNDWDYMECKLFKSINEHFSSPHVGAEILSKSKKIMNEVMVLAQLNNCEIFYQDTDSMHLWEADIPKLAKLFKQKYNKELIGKNMNQFHSDFSSKKFKSKSIVSKLFVGLGKKSYINLLQVELDQGNNNNNGPPQYAVDYHVRHKGINLSALEAKAKSMECSMIDLFKIAYCTTKIKYDLCAGNKVIFNFNKKYQVQIVSKFEREVCFKLNKYEIGCERILQEIRNLKTHYKLDDTIFTKKNETALVPAVNTNVNLEQVSEESMDDEMKMDEVNSDEEVLQGMDVTLDL